MVHELGSQASRTSFLDANLGHQITSSAEHLRHGDVASIIKVHDWI